MDANQATVADSHRQGRCRKCGKETLWKPKCKAYRMYCSTECQVIDLSERRKAAPRRTPDPDDVFGPETVKRCCACRQVLPVACFSKNASSRDGLQIRCKDCKRRQAAEYRERNRELLRRRQIKWRLDNPDKVLESERKRDPATRSQHAKKNRLKQKYGLTPEQFEAMARAQHFLCAICRQSPCDIPGGRGLLHVDHDHETGRVRGLLCVNCNVGLGYFFDTPALLREAAAYLERVSDEGAGVRSGAD